MEWSTNEETLLVSLVRAKADATDLSKFMLVKEVFKSVGKTLSENCSREFTAACVAKKFKYLLENWRCFICFITKPSIYYVEENNWVLASADYMLNHTEHESFKNRSFRIHGMPNFNILGELFEFYGIEEIDFQLMSLELQDA
ncbi:hypothetical protein C2S52_019850 [Perilla frutescens var. hirtella]|nr:hypothetical protein C2S52_019850 [Perilla frutescens var. hirtella]